MRGEQDALRVRRPVITRDRVSRYALFLALVFDRRQWRLQLLEPFFSHQHGFLSGGDVHIPKRAVLAGVVALNERDLLTVGTPLDRLRRAAGDAALGKDVLDRQRFSLSRRE